MGFYMNALILTISMFIRNFLLKSSHELKIKKLYNYINV